MVAVSIVQEIGIKTVRSKQQNNTIKQKKMLPDVNIKEFKQTDGITEATLNKC